MLRGAAARALLIGVQRHTVVQGARGVCTAGQPADRFLHATAQHDALSAQALRAAAARVVGHCCLALMYVHVGTCWLQQHVQLGTRFK